MIRLVRSLFALLALAGICVGVPYLLLVWGRVTVPSWSLLTQPDDGRLLVTLLTLSAWGCWLLVLVDLGAALVAALTRGRLQWRATSVVRPLTSSLVAMLLGLSVLRPAVAAPATTPPVAATEVEGQRSHAAPAPRLVVVATEGDDLWSLAERGLGDGERWKELELLNPGCASRHLVGGETIRVPDDFTGASLYRVVTVAPGDSLWTLAERWLGDGERWRDIRDLNPRVTDPDAIDVGWDLKLPAPDRPNAPNKPTPATDTEPRVPSPAPSNVDAPEPSNAPAEVPGKAVEDTQKPDVEADAIDPVLAVTGSLGAVVAAAVMAGLMTRRNDQSRQRAPGRRVLHPDPITARFGAALAALGASTAPTDTPPDCYDGSPTAEQPHLTPPPFPASPTTAVIGHCEHGSVTLDMADTHTVGVRGEPVDVEGLLGGLVTSLACAEWSEQTRVVVAGAALDWVAELDRPQVEVASTPRAAALWAATHARRTREQTEDDDSPDEVFVFADPLPDSMVDALAPHPRMHAVIAHAATTDAVICVDSDERATMTGRPTPFTPQLIHAPARRALIELHHLADSLDTTPAPWWQHPPEGGELPQRLRPREEVHLPTTHEGEEEVHTRPMLKLLGPIDLVGARGRVPSRALKQCIEYAA